MTPVDFIDAVLSLTSPWESSSNPTAMHDGQASERDAPALADLLSTWSTDRLRRLASKQLVGWFSSYSAQEIEEMVGQNALKTKRTFHSRQWPLGTVDCLLIAANDVRVCLIDIAVTLRVWHVDRTAAAVGETDGRSLKTDRPNTSASSGQSPKGNPLEQWQRFHTVAGELPEPHRTTWLLAHYLDLPEAHYPRLAVDFKLLDGSIRHARVLIQQQIDRR